MEPNAIRYYQPSGAVPFAGTILMQLFGAVTALVLAAIYAAVDRWVPFIFLTFFAVFFFGAGVGCAVSLGAKVGKVRSPGFVLLLGTASGILAVYFAWVFYIFFYWEMKLITWNPSLIFENMELFAEIGLWSLGSWTPTGFWLWSVWAIEAAMIVLISLAVSISNDKPFCDDCNCWTKKIDDAASFPVTDSQKLKEDLEAEKYEVLDELHKGGVNKHNHLKAILYSCPQCEDSDYLTVSHVQITISKDGEESKNETEIIERLRIPRELADHLQELKERPSYEEDAEASKPVEEVEF